MGNDPSYAPLTEFVIRASDAVTAVSESLARATRDNFCGDALPCEIEVIPNFVDTVAFSPDAAPVDPGPPFAVHVSNFRPVKRVPWLVEAFDKATRGTDSRLVLVGDGPDQGRCRELARQLGVCDRVSFLGPRDALPELLAPARVFLLASREESFGLSALEAMSCGTPVVATDVGGVSEVVEHGVSGLLARADDQDGYAECVRALLADDERAGQMSRAARAASAERFDRDNVVGRYEALYRRLIEAR